MNLDLTAKAAKRMAVATLSSSGTAASVAAVIANPLLRDVLVYGAWGSLGLGMVSLTTWGAAKAWPAQPFTSSEVASERDLAQIHRIARRYFGSKVTTTDRMHEWVKRNPNIFEIVVRVRHAGRHRLSTVDGYYCALPVHEKAASDLIAEVRGINDIRAEELCAPSQVPFAVYVGAVACGSEAGKQVALLGLRRMVQRFARKRYDLPVLTRPITDDGLRLVSAFGFQPVRKALESPMGALHLQTMGQLSQRRGRRIPGSAAY